MKIQLCNKIKIIPIQYVLSRTVENIVPTEQKYLVELRTDDNVFRQESAIEQGNFYVNQSVELNIANITVGQVSLLFGAKVAVILEATNGVRRAWGNNDYPVICNVDVHTDGAKIKLVGKSPEPVIF